MIRGRINNKIWIMSYNENRGQESVRSYFVRNSDGTFLLLESSSCEQLSIDDFTYIAMQKKKKTTTTVSLCRLLISNFPPTL